jgi:hypothetical protein
MRSAAIGRRSDSRSGGGGCHYRVAVASSLAMADPGSQRLPQTGLDLRIAEAIAGQVVILVREELGIQPPTDEWIDAKEVARRSGFSRAWVYAHARQPRPRLRFDSRIVSQALRTIGSTQTDAAGRSPDADAGGAQIHVPPVRSKRSRF